jgi:cyclic-di-AMP phosphodiesterase PgpH
MHLNIFQKKMSRMAQMQAARRLRWADEIKPVRHILALRQFVYALGFFLYSALLVFFAFYGQSPMGSYLRVGQVAKNRITADTSFSYESKIRRQTIIDERRQQLAPFYKLNLDLYYNFRTAIFELGNRLDLLAMEIAANPEAKEKNRELIAVYEKKAEDDLGLTLHSDELIVLLNLSEEDRNEAIREGLVCLQETVQKGVLATEPTLLQTDPSRPCFLRIQTENSEATSDIFVEDTALLNLRRELRSLDFKPATVSALFHILKQGLKPNLVFDETRTQEQMEQIAKTVPPVIVNIEHGQIIAESGLRLSSEQAEMLSAYRHELRTQSDFVSHLDRGLVQHWIATLALLLVALMFVRLTLRELMHSSRKMALCALVILISTLFMRILLEWDSLQTQISSLGILLPYLAPVAFAPMLTVLMLGGAGGVLVAVFSSFFLAMMMQGDISITLLYLLVSLISMRVARGARVRSKVMRAGVLSGLTMAAGALLSGAMTLNSTIIALQMASGLFMGVISALLVISIFPIMELLFKYTTDITLFELTDFNHPLLRRLQAVAPGTYHHSMMVANLSEAAAEAINANSIVCRACALFHDIGKIVKPEYFFENQQEGLNPHNERSPSVSALVIKNHVKEGVEIAKQAKLPKVVVDIIEQHHGTSLIQYFYSKARQQLQQNTHEGIEATFDSDAIDEGTYRYDGPKPNFKESVIIFLADPIEAASRTLKKVTPQKVDELIERIFEERFADHQFDNAPLTLEEITRLKKVFSFILLNMLHSRVEYPSSNHLKETEEA